MTFVSDHASTSAISPLTETMICLGPIWFLKTELRGLSESHSSQSASQKGCWDLGSVMRGRLPRRAIFGSRPGSVHVAAVVKAGMLSL